MPKIQCPKCAANLAVTEQSAQGSVMCDLCGETFAPPKGPTNTTGRRTTVTSTSQFYWRKERTSAVTGPVSARQLKELARDGTLEESSLVSKDGKKWVLAKSVAGLIFADTNCVVLQPVDSADETTPPQLPVRGGDSRLEPPDPMDLFLKNAGNVQHTSSELTTSTASDTSASRIPAGDPTPLSRWHGGKPGVVFFAHPPREIGAVTWSGGTWTSGKRHYSTIEKIAVLFGTIVGILAIGEYFGGGAHASRIGMFVLLVILCPVLWISLSFYETCAFIGTHGAAAFKLTGSATAKPRSLGVLRFAEALYLLTFVQDNLGKSGGYKSTTYSYQWFDVRGKLLYSIEAQDVNKHRDMEYPIAAEQAWNVHLIERFSNQSRLEFRVVSTARKLFGFSTVLYLSRGLLEIEIGGTCHAIRSGEFARFNLSGGVLTIRHVDSRWYSGAGKFRIVYSELGNGALFLMLAQRLLNQQITSEIFLDLL